MSLLFIDGFAHYTRILDKWDSFTGSGNTRADNTMGRFDLGALLIDDIGDVVSKNVTTSDGIAFIAGFAFRGTSNDVTSIAFADATADQLTLRMDISTGGMSLRLGNFIGTEIATAPGGTLSADTWHYIEFKTIIDNVNGSVEIRVDGTPVITLSTTDTQGSSTDSIVSVNFRKLGGIGTSHVDDLYFLNAVGAAPYNDFLGDVKVTTLRPSANGTVNDFSPEGASTNWEATDETIIDDDTTYVKSGVVAARDNYTMQDLSAVAPTVGDIYGVQVVTGAKKLDVGTLRYKDTLVVAGTNYDSAEVVSQPTTYKFSTFMNQINPNTSLAWTESDVNGVNAGFTITFKEV